MLHPGQARALNRTRQRDTLFAIVRLPAAMPQRTRLLLVRVGVVVVVVVRRMCRSQFPLVVAAVAAAAEVAVHWDLL